MGSGLPEKKLLWEPDSLYLEREDAQVPNYVAEWLQKDRRARSFLRALWRLVGDRINKSGGGNP